MEIVEIVIGQFKYNPEKQEVSGPATYMAERGKAKLDSILSGDDAGFNAMMAARPDVPTERLVLIALQTDFSSFLGQQQALGWLRGGHRR